jgi:hypothetical protein
MSSNKIKNKLSLISKTNGKLYHLRNLQSRARTYAVLVIGLYALQCNPITQLIEPPAEIMLKVALNTQKIK